MLPAPNRLKRPSEFSAAVRRGARAASPTVVVHMRCEPEQDPPVMRVGFVVSKKVGDAVTRNRVKRRLRHLVREYLSCEGADVVVRALPGASTSPERMADDLRDAWHRAHAKALPC